MRALDCLAVELGMLSHSPDLDDQGVPVHDRATVYQARKRLLTEWDRANAGDPILPCVEDLDRLTAWWRSRGRPWP